MATRDESQLQQNDGAEEDPTTISRRAHQTISYPAFYARFGKQVEGNMYDKYDNPEGIINMGQAVNQLMEEEVLARLNKGDALTMTARYQYYSCSFGILELRQAVASLLTRHHKPYKAINPDNLIVMNGVTACLDALSHTLCDPDDVVITPTPVYGRIFTDFQDRSRASVVPLVALQEENFELQPQDMEKLIQKIKSEGQSVRACVILHPNNPLGYVSSTSYLRSIMEICAQHEIHVIVDEIYAFSIYDKETEFNSVLRMESVPDPLRTHVLWGFSKDFSIPGFRLGVIHSTNPLVLSCLKTVSHYHSSPQLIQHAAATIINDKEWCDSFYIPTSQKRLAEAYHKARQRLEAMGVVVKKSVAGLFLWANMQAFLQPCNADNENALFTALLNGGVIISPGQMLHCSNAGWFRIVFAVTNEELEIGLSRIEAVLCKWKRSVKTNSA